MYVTCTLYFDCMYFDRKFSNIQNVSMLVKNSRLEFAIPHDDTIMLYNIWEITTIVKGCWNIGMTYYSIFGYDIRLHKTIIVASTKASTYLRDSFLLFWIEVV